MPKILTKDLNSYRLSPEEQLHVYNGLDTCIMHDLLGVLKTHLHKDDTEITYNFERAMLGPALAMMRRGVKVDETYKVELTKELELRYDKLLNLSRILGGVIWANSESFNPNSTDQLAKYFYDGFGIEPFYSHKSKTRKPSVDEDTLEKLKEGFPIAEPMARCILSLRETKKRLDVLRYGIDPDGRLRTFYDVAGTRTGRWASRTSVHDTGGNLQNWEKRMRQVIVSDPGYIMFDCDLEQAESRAVAYLSGDEAYIAACEGGDLHTDVAVGVFNCSPDIVESENAPGLSFTRRHMAKVSGHGTNYMLTPTSLARYNKIKIAAATKFQALYKGLEVPLDAAVRWGWCDARGGVIDPDFAGRIELNKRKETITVTGKFGGIARWQEETTKFVKENGYLITPLGRKRQFWKRLSDDKTIREAVAFVPQSLIGDLLNLGLWNIWYQLELANHPAVEPGDLQLLLQVHDSVVGQIKKDKVDVILPLVLECLTNPITVNGRTMIVPASAKVGLNWRERKVDKDTGEVTNDAGLWKWKKS